MIQLSRRFAPHIAILCGLTLVPVAIHQYLDVRRDECADPFRLVPSTHRGEVKQKRDETMRSQFKAFSWREGRVDGSPQLHYAVVRSYDAKELYYRFERGLLNKAEPGRMDRITLTDDAGDVSRSLPARRLHFKRRPGSSQLMLASYMLVYDGQPVANPYWNQLRAAPMRLLLGRLPMTIFFVYGITTESGLVKLEERQSAWLLDSWRSYRSICFPDGNGGAAPP